MSKKNRQENFFLVTHFVVEPPPIKGLRKLSFLTTTQRSFPHKFYVGFGEHRSFSIDELKPKLIAGSIIELPVPTIINKGFGLWMDPEKNVYLANLNDPYLGKKERVYNHEISYKISHEGNKEEEFIGLIRIRNVEKVFKDIFEPSFEANASNKYRGSAATTPAKYQLRTPFSNIPEKLAS